MSKAADSRDRIICDRCSFFVIYKILLYEIRWSDGKKIVHIYFIRVCERACMCMCVGTHHKTWWNYHIHFLFDFFSWEKRALFACVSTRKWQFSGETIARCQSHWRKADKVAFSGRERELQTKASIKWHSCVGERFSFYHHLTLIFSFCFHINKSVQSLFVPFFNTTFILTIWNALLPNETREKTWRVKWWV